MKNKKLRNGILVLLVLIVAMLSYSILESFEVINLRQFFGEKTTDVQDDRVLIGFSLGTLKEERWLKDRDILIAKVKELGGDILVQNANNDDKDQLNQVKYLLEQGIDVLVIVPNDLQKAAYAVELAKRQGVKVISYDRLVLKANADVYISFDNYMVGELMAKHLLEAVPNGSVLIINGAKSDNNTKMIKEGYDRVLSDKLKSGEIEIIGEEWAPNWMKEYAFGVTDKLLQDKKHIDGIIAGNDSLAEGAIEALSEHRLAGKVTVTGQDADLSACQRIVEGTQIMTVYKPIDKMAAETAKLAMKLAQGQRLGISKTIYDGKYDIPYYMLEPIAVTKENMDDTIIKDGFHLREEVYRK